MSAYKDFKNHSKKIEKWKEKKCAKIVKTITISSTYVILYQLMSHLNKTLIRSSICLSVAKIVKNFPKRTLLLNLPSPVRILPLKNKSSNRLVVRLALEINKTTFLAGHLQSIKLTENLQFNNSWLKVRDFPDQKSWYLAISTMMSRNFTVHQWKGK
jgi:hypothetical protein